MGLMLASTAVVTGLADSVGSDIKISGGQGGSRTLTALRPADFKCELFRYNQC